MIARAAEPTTVSARATAVVLAVCLVVLALVAPSVAGASGAAHGNSRPVALTADGLASVEDLDPQKAPRFGWHVSSDLQTAYEIRVSSTQKGAKAKKADVWGSGRVSSDAQYGVNYAGPSLDSAQRYFWRVRTWDGRGAPSPWSSVAHFGTGPGSAWSDSSPIWAPSAVDGWKNYTLESNVTVEEVATGVSLRASDSRNFYMWQLRGADNQLVPHKQVNGSYSVLKTVDLPPGTLAIGKEVALTIELDGPTITTSIDGKVVDVTTDDTFSAGVVGFRNGRTETGVFTDLSVVDDATGKTLLQTDFPEGDATFGCGTVADHALTVGRSEACLVAALSNDWAFLRKDVDLDRKKIAWATVHATGSSPKPAKQYVYKLYVNGTFVGLGPTQSIGNESRYDGFEVTDLLRANRTNTLAAVAYTTSGQKFQAELVIGYLDGSRRVVGTGSDWSAMSGGAVLPDAGSIGTNYYAAPTENIDARTYPTGFDTAGFDDTSWDAAQTKPAFDALVDTPTEKVDEQHRAPVTIVDKGDGDYFVDFGRTWVGGVHYTVADGVSGDSVDVRYGESTSSEDTVRYDLNTGNTYRDVFTLRDGSQTFDTWGMRVFRYVEIVDAPEPVTAENLQALALVYPFDEQAATLTSSDQNLNQVWRLAKNTIESLNVNFYTDSWTRERTNYEADGYLQLLSTLYLDDDLSLGRYSMNYFKGNRTWPTEWPIYVILAVHDAWWQTGDTAQLADYYENLQSKLPTKWLEESTGLIRKESGSSGAGSCTDCDIVDWPSGERDGFVFRPYNTVINAISYRAYRDMADVATELGKDSDAATYTRIADGIRTAVNDKMFDPATGRYDDGLDANGNRTGHSSLHASVFPLAFGLVDDEHVSDVADYIESRGMACSVYCAAFLVKALYDGDDGQAALDVLTSTGTKSWMNMVDLGAGATMEAWDPSLKPNLTYSHPWAASPAFNVPSGLFGVKPLEAGYETFEVKPQPGDLDHGSTTVPTVRGEIATAFSRGPQDRLRLAVTVPGNTRATLSLPATGDTMTTVYLDGRPRSVAPERGYLSVSGVGAGCHVLTTERKLDPHHDSILDICNH